MRVLDFGGYVLGWLVGMVWGWCLLGLISLFFGFTIGFGFWVSLIACCVLDIGFMDLEFVVFIV